MMSGARETTEETKYVSWEFDFDRENYLWNSAFPRRFVFESKGRIVSDEFNRKPVLMGKFRTFVVDVESAIEEGISIVKLFNDDAYTVDYSDLYADESGAYTNQIVSLFDELQNFFRPNLLILDRLTIYPQFRNRGIGLEVLRALIQRRKMGTGLIAMKPYPLQFDTPDPVERKKLGFDKFTMSQRTATLKLCKYYGRLGFIRLPKTPFMIRSALSVLPEIA